MEGNKRVEWSVVGTKEGGWLRETDEGTQVEGEMSWLKKTKKRDEMVEGHDGGQYVQDANDDKKKLQRIRKRKTISTNFAIPSFTPNNLMHS